jgi:hypothetical protein
VHAFSVHQLSLGGGTARRYIASTLHARDDYNFALYQYTPELVPAIIAAALFSIGGVVHVIFLRRLRANYYIPFAAGCFCMKPLHIF